MEEALCMLKENNFAPLSNKSYSLNVMNSSEWDVHHIVADSPSWTGTMAAYDKPDQKLGKTIVYIDAETDLRYEFPVPEEHRGKKDVILVAEYPDYTIKKDGRLRTIDAKKVDVISRFPSDNNCFTLGYCNRYLGDRKHDIPRGNITNNTNSLSLYRIQRRVGLIVRGPDIHRGRFDHDIGLDYAPSEELAILIEK